jgi:serine/threonine-protein kinase HipA
MPSQKYGHASYERLALFVGDLCGLEDMQELLRRVWFSVLCGNTDAHLKNWSLIYPDRRSARLAPAYDLVFVRPYIDKPDLALALAKERDMRRVSWEHVSRVERFLRKAGHDINVVANARSFVARARDSWASQRGQVGPSYAQGIEQHLSVIPLASL